MTRRTMERPPPHPLQKGLDSGTGNSNPCMAQQIFQSIISYHDSFIGTDDTTRLRQKLDVARIQIQTESKFRIDKSFEVEIQSKSY
jgi:hypothetical protein